MPQADIVYDEQLTAQDLTGVGSDSYTSCLTAGLADYTAGKKYLVIANAQVAGSSNALLFQHRLTHGATPTEFVGSEMIYEPNSGTLTNCHLYGWAGEFTQPGGGAEDIDHEHLTQDTSETVRSDTIQINSISLDDLSTRDYASGEQDDSGGVNEHSATLWEDRATTCAFSCNIGDLLLLVAHVSIEVNTVSANWQAEIDLDSGTQLIEAAQEGEDTAGKESFVLMRGFVATGISHTFKVRTRDDGTGGTRHGHIRSYIIVINLTTAPYEQAVILYDASEAQASSNTLEQVGSDQTINHTTAGGVTTLAYASHNTDAASRSSKIQIKSGEDASEAEVPTGQSSNSYRSFDPTELVPMFVQADEAVGTGNRDYQLFVQAQNTAATKDFNSLVIFTHELITSFPYQKILHGPRASLLRR